MFPLIAIATSILPDLIKLIAGDKAGTLATDVANAVKTVTGTSDPAAAKQKLATDPAVAANLQVQLAQIALSAAKQQNDELNQQRADELADLNARLQDIHDARSTLTDLAKNQSGVVWVAPTVSFLVMIGFYVLLVILILKFTDADLSKNQLINICIGALVAAFSTVVNFWLGSSKGSQDKDRASLQLQTAAAQQTSQTLQTQAKQTADALAAATTTATSAAAASAAVARIAPSAGSPPKTDSSTNFSQCVAVIFTEEGGYTDNPADPGGPTNFGITLADLQAWRGPSPVLTAADVKNMSKTEAQEIYRSKYWNPVQGDDLPNGIDLEVFDFGVLAGVHTSIKILQTVIGVTADGSVGPITLAAAKAADPRTVIANFSSRRMDYLRTLGDWANFGAGWTNRNNSVEQLALKMTTAIAVA
jgi:hypothetical protein